MVNVLVAVADGSEDIETVTVVDTLRRAGVAVTLASVMGVPAVTCANGTKITADALVEDCAGKEWDAVIAPGGMPGAEHLAANKTFTGLLKKQQERQKLIGAICAAPAVVLAAHDLLQGKKATCYPGFEEALLESASDFQSGAVVSDGSVITSRGPATALPFALALVEALCGVEVAGQVASGMLATR